MDKLLYEIIPPPKSWPKEKVNEFTGKILGMLIEEEIATICLPEVINEEREDERTVPFAEKLDAIDFSEFILNSAPHFTLIPYKISVRQPLDRLLEFVDALYAKGIRHLVLVGGEHHVIHYPGPSVKKAAQLLKEKYPDLILGAITIFTRAEEEVRILEKMKHGIDFFISQIIFESANMKRVMLNLQHLCEEQGRALPLMYLSVAPATEKKDIRFMQWLGVEFPSAILSHFLHAKEEELEGRVFEVIDMMLEEILFFKEKTAISLNYNLEQVMFHNSESAKKLITSIKRGGFLSGNPTI